MCVSREKIQFETGIYSLDTVVQLDSVSIPNIWILLNTKHPY